MGPKDNRKKTLMQKESGALAMTKVWCQSDPNCDPLNVLAQQIEVEGAGRMEQEDPLNVSLQKALDVEPHLIDVDIEIKEEALEPSSLDHDCDRCEMSFEQKYQLIS